MNTFDGQPLGESPEVSRMERAAAEVEELREENAALRCRIQELEAELAENRLLRNPHTVDKLIRANANIDNAVRVEL